LATEIRQELLHYPIERGRLIKERTPTKVCGITFEAFSVEHSILSPTVGYRVSAGRANIFYAPDLIFIHERSAALKDVQIYIGDGAGVTRSFVRKRGRALIGHSSVRTQLNGARKKACPAQSSRIAARKLPVAAHAKSPRKSTPSPPSEVSKCASITME
jgi:hypothetical protein